MVFLGVLSVLIWCTIPGFRLPSNLGSEILKNKTWKLTISLGGSLSSGFLSQSTCQHLLFRVLRGLLHAFCPGFLIVFNGREKLEGAYSILTEIGNLSFINFQYLEVTSLWEGRVFQNL